MSQTLVRQATGTSAAASTSVTATLAVAATAGNIIHAIFGGDKNSGTITPPSGTWNVVVNSLSASVSFWWGWKEAVGGETAITVSHATASAAGDTLWVGEYSDTNTGGTWTILGSASDLTTEATRTVTPSGTTAATTGVGTALAAFAIDSGQSATATPTYSNTYTSVKAYAASGRGDVAVAVLANLASGSAATTTQTHTPTADQTSGAIVVFAKVGGAATQTVTLTSGIATGEALGAATVTGGLVTVTASGVATGEAVGTPTVTGGVVTSYPIVSAPVVRTTNGNGPDTLTLPAGILGGDLIIVAQAINNASSTAAVTPTASGMTFTLIGSQAASGDTLYYWWAKAAGTFGTASADAGKAVTISTTGATPGKYSALAVVLDGNLVDQTTPIVAGSFTSAGFTNSSTTRAMPAHAMSQAGRVLAVVSDKGAPPSQSATPGAGYTNIGDTGIVAGTAVESIMFSWTGTALQSSGAAVGGGTWTFGVATTATVLSLVEINPPAAGGAQTVSVTGIGTGEAFGAATLSTHWTGSPLTPLRG
jgi:hypothetical protein